MTEREINKRIDFFEKQLENDYLKQEKEIEKRRRKFVSEYSISAIPNLALDDYVSGLKTSGLDKDYNNFCYKLEIGLKDMGDFRVARVNKFGVYYSVKHGRYMSDEKKFGADVDKAFRIVKGLICELLRAGGESDDEAILASPLVPTYKYRLLSVYYPEKYICIFSEKHISEFLDKLNLSCGKNISMLDKQRALFKWRDGNVRTEGWSNYILMTFLYNCIEIPSYDKWCRYEAYMREDDVQDDKLIESIADDTSVKVKMTTHDFKRKDPPRTFVSNGRKVYARDKATALNALNISQYRCEIDSSHKTFIKKSDNNPYMEPHHLVPMSAQDDFRDASLDVTENIVSLCSNCHNEIHYGINRKELVIKLFKERKELLEKAGINIELDRLLEYYDIPNSSGL